MKTKKEFRYFSIFNHEKEQDYLREQHKCGWKFVKVSGLCTYHFEECEPEDVIYQLDFNPDGSEHKDEYIQMFADCGWEYMQEYVGYSYFRKPAVEMVDEEEIFCDDSSRMEMLNRVYKGRLLPLLIIFSACLMPQFVLNMSNGHVFVAAVMGSIMLVYVVVFAYCAIHYYRKKKNIE